MPDWRGFPASINPSLTVRIGAAITTIDASSARWDADGTPTARLLPAFSPPKKMCNKANGGKPRGALT